MKSKMHVTTYLSLSICLSLLFYGGMLSVPIFAQVEQNTPASPPTATTPSKEHPPFEAKATTEQHVSFDDVYEISLALPFAGNVELTAADREDIVIKLEKHGTGINKESAKRYIDQVTLEAPKIDDSLQLKVKLPAKPGITARLTRIDCFIETPPDVSLKLLTKNGTIRVNGIRGDMVLTTAIGHVYLNETLGGYRVNVGKGRIYGKILLINRDNVFKTEAGDINLVVLDTLSTVMDMTAVDGDITLRLPKDYPADLELKTESEDQRAIDIQLPVELETAFVGDVMRGSINGGGPILRITTSNRISILPLELSPSKPEAKADTLDDEDDDYLIQSVPKAVEPPTIDGILFEKAWEKAPLLHAFSHANGESLADEPTFAQLMWDDKYLYVGVKAYDAKMAQVRISQTKEDSAVWADDALEILVDPNPATDLYYHIIVNPIGILFDQVVKSDYPPDPRFAPSDENRKRAKPPKSLMTDKSWDSQAQIQTKIASHFWTVEIALPRAALESASESNWQLNLHRKVQRNSEYSYWLPTYNTNQPWWPHQREAMGKLKLIEGKAPDSPQAFEAEDKLKIADIEIDGNGMLSTPVILQRMPFQPGDVITVNQLSWLKDELADCGWFSEVRLETSVPPSNSDASPSDASPDRSTPQEQTANQDARSRETPPEEVGDTEATPSKTSEMVPAKVIVHIHVDEVPIRDAKGFNISKNDYFRSNQLREWFGLVPGPITVEELNTKTELMTQLYRNHGYTLATISQQFSDNDILFEVDEGYLDEIRFIGNKYVLYRELVEALEMQPGEVYHQAKGESRIKSMRTKLNKGNPNFKGIEKWRASRINDKNVLVIEVQEQSLFNIRGIPRIDFNRVHGLVLGGGGEISTAKHNGIRTFGTLQYGISSEYWDFQLGVEKSWFDKHRLSLGGSPYQLTDTIYDATLSATEEFLASMIFGKSTLDYYQRQGAQGWLAQQLTPSTSVRLELTGEAHRNLFKSTDWSLFNRKTFKPSNKRVGEGSLVSVSLTYEFDSRDRKSYTKRDFRPMPRPHPGTTRGWRGYFSVEYAAPSIESDFDFTRYHFQVVRYNRLSRRHNLDFRLWGSFSDTFLPRQRLLYLGGFGTLRGYEQNEFIGDNMLLFNLEYRLTIGQPQDSDETGGVRNVATIFLDTGDAWFNDGSFAWDNLNTSVGVGYTMISSDAPVPTEFRIEVARALRKERGLQVILRLHRIF